MSLQSRHDPTFASGLLMTEKCQSTIAVILAVPLCAVLQDIAQDRSRTAGPHWSKVGHMRKQRGRPWILQLG
jgi:hypothetical protein